MGVRVRVRRLRGHLTLPSEEVRVRVRVRVWDWVRVRARVRYLALPSEEVLLGHGVHIDGHQLDLVPCDAAPRHAALPRLPQLRARARG